MTTCFHCDAPIDTPPAGAPCASCGGRTAADDLSRESCFKRSTPVWALAALTGVGVPLAGAVAMASGATPRFSPRNAAMLALVSASFAAVFAVPGWIAWRSLSRVRPRSRVRWALSLFFGLSLTGMVVFAVGAGVLARRLPTPLSPATPPSPAP